MSKRAYNFNAGPAALPLEVLQEAQAEFVDFRGIGMSIMEVSHRSKEYEAVHDETRHLLSRLLGLPDSYKVLFIQGGASLQFAMVPLNLTVPGKVPHYVLSGSWAQKAYEEAKRIGEAAVAASSPADLPLAMPDVKALQIADNAAYVHITSNETIAGTQYPDYPDTGSVPLVGDLSSDILSREIDAERFALIYAGAQKNLGPAGVTIVVVREDLLQHSLPEQVPLMLRYETYLKNNSLYNTPPVYSIYMVNLVLKWIEKQGGVAVVERRNREKAALIYDAIDGSGGFYEGMAAKASRSIMNITFKLQSGELENRFLREAEENGFIGLKGHRSVGHLRASVYNAVPYENCKALAEFMADFMRRHG